MSEQVTVPDPNPELVSNNYNSAHSIPWQISALFRVRSLRARLTPLTPGNCGMHSFPYPVDVNRRGRMRPIRVSNVGFVLLCCTALVSSQAVKDSPLPAAQERIEKVRVDHSDNNGGPLYVSVGDRELRVTDKALNAWIVGGGRQVVYSAPDGAGGYENEGNALHLYDLQSGKERKILSEYFAIDRVTEVRTRNRKTAFLVEMRDGGLGASHVAVVDPRRGEVFIASKTRLQDRTGDLFVLGFYRDDDWEALANGKDVQPYKVRRYDLKRLLLRAPIHRVRAP